MAEDLFKKLEDYSRSDIYPFCMPGHKRRFDPDECTNFYKLDITEVDGFDDLQKCEGLLGDVQAELSDIYGCESVFISVNGSSAGNLAAIICLPEGGRILADASCHRSVFNACRINKRTLLLLEREKLPFGLTGAVSAEEAERFFEEYADIRALIVTSPTYEGFMCDIPALAKAAHSHGAFLIVDEAHGAHLPFCKRPFFPESAIYQGADIVIESLHKTLPALNQTSLVFVPHDKKLAAHVKEALNMVTTTSPSYILMASAQRACRWAHANPAEFSLYSDRLSRLRKDLIPLKNIALIDKSIIGNYNTADLDPGKLVLAPIKETSTLDGPSLYFRLLEKYSLQMEKYENGFVLAMTSVMDTPEGLNRLKDALFETDRSL